MTEKQKRILKIFMVAILMVSMYFSMYFLAGEKVIFVNSGHVEQKGKPCVVIDAGHGDSYLRE